MAKKRVDADRVPARPRMNAALEEVVAETKAQKQMMYDILDLVLDLHSAIDDLVWPSKPAETLGNLRRAVKLLEAIE